MRSIRVICLGILLALPGIFIPVAANAQAQHTYYIHALSDLGTARRLLLQHINGNPMTHNEKEALRQINELIREISEAPITGAGEVNNDLKAPASLTDAQPLLKCVEFLKKAKADISHEEDSQFAGGLRDRSVKNCDGAIKFVGQIRQ